MYWFTSLMCVISLSDHYPELPVLWRTVGGNTEQTVKSGFPVVARFLAVCLLTSVALWVAWAGGIFKWQLKSYFYVFRMSWKAVPPTNIVDGDGEWEGHMNITTRRILHSEWRGPLLCLQTNCLKQNPLYLLGCFHIRINMGYTLFYYYYPISNFLPGCECMLYACLVLVSTPACMCLKARGGWQVSSSVTFHLSF